MLYRNIRILLYVVVPAAYTKDLTELFWQDFIK